MHSLYVDVLGVYMFVVLASMSAGSFFQSPYGRLMCLHMCGRTVGCYSYEFITRHLSCTVPSLSPRPPPEQGRFLVKDYKLITRNKTETCQNGSRIFYSRLDTLQCIRNLGALYFEYVRVKVKEGKITPVVTAKFKEGKSTPVNGEKAKKPLKMTRLLILPLSGTFQTAQTPRQLALQNNSITEMKLVNPFLGALTAHAMGYISSSRKVIIATQSGIMLVDPDTGRSSYMMGMISGNGVAVDDINHQLFITVHTAVMETTADGGVMKNIFQMKGHLSGIAADSKRCMLYVVNLFRSVLKIPYSGKNKMLVDSGHIKPSICIDSERDVLYYMKRTLSTICRMSLAGNSQTNVVELGLNVKYFLAVGSRFYVSEKSDIIVVNGDGTRSRVDTGFMTYATTDVVFCAIP